MAGPRLGPFVQRQRRSGPGDGGRPSGREGQPRVLPGPAVPDVGRRPGLDASRTRRKCRRLQARGQPAGRRFGGGRLAQDLVGRHHRRRPAPLPRLGLHEGPAGRRDQRGRSSRGPDPGGRRRKVASGSSRPRDPDPSGPVRLQQAIPVVLRRADSEDPRRREARKRHLEGRSVRGDRVPPVAGSRPVSIPDRRRLGPLAREPIERLGLPRLSPGPRDSVEAFPGVRADPRRDGRHGRFAALPDAGAGHAREGLRQDRERRGRRDPGRVRGSPERAALRVRPPGQRRVFRGARPRLAGSHPHRAGPLGLKGAGAGAFGRGV